MQAILRRFRKEVRERDDIYPDATVVLCDAPEREGNTLAATLLLEEIFDGRITIERSPDGLLCGSREEAGSLRIARYTTGEDADTDILLSSLTRHEIGTYLNERTGEDHMVFVPDTPEVRLIERLAERYPSVRHGV